MVGMDLDAKQRIFKIKIFSTLIPTSEQKTSYLSYKWLSG